MTHDHRAYWRGHRCDTCRAAYNAYARDYRRRRTGRGPEPTEPDAVAVYRACRGDRSITLTRWEMAAALTQLDVPPRSLNEIAAILGVTQRTVVRWRTGRTTLPRGRPARGRNAA